MDFQTKTITTTETTSATAVKPDSDHLFDLFPSLSFTGLDIDTFLAMPKGDSASINNHHQANDKNQRHARSGLISSLFSDAGSSMNNYSNNSSTKQGRDSHHRHSLLSYISIDSSTDLHSTTSIPAIATGHRRHSVFRSRSLRKLIGGNAGKRFEENEAYAANSGSAVNSTVNPAINSTNPASTEGLENHQNESDDLGSPESESGTAKHGQHSKVFGGGAHFPKGGAGQEASTTPAVASTSTLFRLGLSRDSKNRRQSMPVGSAANGKYGIYGVDTGVDGLDAKRASLSFLDMAKLEFSQFEYFEDFEQSVLSEIDQEKASNEHEEFSGLMLNTVQEEEEEEEVSAEGHNEAQIEVEANTQTYSKTPSTIKVDKSELDLKSLVVDPDMICVSPSQTSIEPTSPRLSMSSASSQKPDRVRPTPLSFGPSSSVPAPSSLPTAALNPRNTPPETSASATDKLPESSTNTRASNKQAPLPIGPSTPTNPGTPLHVLINSPLAVCSANAHPPERQKKHVSPLRRFKRMFSNLFHIHTNHSKNEKGPNNGGNGSSSTPVTGSELNEKVPVPKPDDGKGGIATGRPPYSQTPNSGTLIYTIDAISMAPKVINNADSENLTDIVAVVPTKKKKKENKNTINRANPNSTELKEEKEKNEEEKIDVTVDSTGLGALTISASRVALPPVASPPTTITTPTPIFTPTTKPKSTTTTILDITKPSPTISLKPSSASTSIPPTTTISDSTTPLSDFTSPISYSTTPTISSSLSSPVSGITPPPLRDVNTADSTMSPLSKKSLSQLINSRLLRSASSFSSGSTKATGSVPAADKRQDIRKQNKASDNTNTTTPNNNNSNAANIHDSDGIWDPFESSDDESDDEYIMELQDARAKYNMLKGIDESGLPPYGYAEWKKTRREWAGAGTKTHQTNGTKTTTNNSNTKNNSNSITATNTDEDDLDALLKDLDDEDRQEDPLSYHQTQQAAKLAARKAAQKSRFVSTLTNVPESSYPGIYKMLVKDNRRLKKPMPLADALVVMKAGWVATGQWPPPSTA